MAGVGVGRKRQAEDKLHRAVPRPFLKLFLGGGLLIIFPAVHKEAFKYNIWAPVNRDTFPPMAGIF